jgi:predicted transcriptional regulator
MLSLKKYSYCERNHYIYTLNLFFMKQLKEIIRLTVIKQSPHASRLGASQPPVSMYCSSNMESPLLKMIKNAEKLYGYFSDLFIINKKKQYGNTISKKSN